MHSLVGFLSVVGSMHMRRNCGAQKAQPMPQQAIIKIFAFAGMHLEGTAKVEPVDMFA
jgi:hypothetical protein